MGQKWGKASDFKAVENLPISGIFCKSGGYRTLLSVQLNERYVFLHRFAKSDKSNITQAEKKALQFAGKVFLELSASALLKAVQSGVLMEVCCEQNDRVSP